MKGKRNEKRSKKSAILKQHARNLFVGAVIVLFVSMSFRHFCFRKGKGYAGSRNAYIYYKSIKIMKKAILCGISQMKIFLKNIVRQKNMLKFLRR